MWWFALKEQDYGWFLHLFFLYFLNFPWWKILFFELKKNWPGNVNRFNVNIQTNEKDGEQHHSHWPSFPLSCSECRRLWGVCVPTHQSLHWAFLSCLQMAKSSPGPRLLWAGRKGGLRVGVCLPKPSGLILPLSLLGYQQDAAPRFFLPWFPQTENAVLCLDSSLMDCGYNHFKTLSELDEDVLQPLQI